MRPLLILRPEPGAAATAARARARGRDAIVAPLFAIGPVAWTPPDPAGFDALLLTSANALRHAGPALGRYARLPAYAVGAATAAAACAAGFTRVMAGDGDAATVAALAAAAGATRLLHLAGREHRAAGTVACRVVVYAADAVAVLPQPAAAALAAGAVALVHSPRAAAVLAALTAGLPRGHTAIAAISPAAAAAAGEGWQAVVAAARPTDDALLAVAARLCDDPPR